MCLLRRFLSNAITEMPITISFPGDDDTILFLSLRKVFFIFFFSKEKDDGFKGMILWMINGWCFF